MDFLQTKEIYFDNMKIYFDNVSAFQEICALYKSVLDKNFGGRFCIGEHCKTVFMVEIKIAGNGNLWGSSPKIFDAKEKAEEFVKEIKNRYPFVSECRIITRKIEEKIKND